MGSIAKRGDDTTIPEENVRLDDDIVYLQHQILHSTVRILHNRRFIISSVDPECKSDDHIIFFLKL